MEMGLVFLAFEFVMTIITPQFCSIRLYIVKVDTLMAPGGDTWKLSKV